MNQKLRATNLEKLSFLTKIRKFQYSVGRGASAMRTLSRSLSIPHLEIPQKCQINASFVTDTWSLKHPIDWKSDDLGSFLNGGRVGKGFFDTSDEVSLISNSRSASSTDTTVQLRKNYWTHLIHWNLEVMSYGAARAGEVGTSYCSTSLK